MDPALQAKIEQAARILREAGATEVYVFGSAVDPDEQLPGHEPQDLDLAVEGLRPEIYFDTLGELMWQLRMPVDLIPLDSPSPFVKRLRKSGSLRRVA
jgi:predicted nucleotidyltransferase